MLDLLEHEMLFRDCVANIDVSSGGDAAGGSLEDNVIVADEISFCNHGNGIKALGGGCGKKFLGSHCRRLNDASYLA